MLFYAYEIARSMKRMHLICDTLKQKIKSKRKETKNIAAGISIQEAFIKSVQFEAYYIYKDMDDGVKLRDSIRVILTLKYLYCWHS